MLYGWSFSVLFRERPQRNWGLLPLAPLITALVDCLDPVPRLSPTSLAALASVVSTLTAIYWACATYWPLRLHFLS